MQRIYNYINGSFVEPTSGHYLNSVNPAIAEIYAFVPDSDERDVEAAVAAAHAAFPQWSTFEPWQRAHFLNLIANRIEEKTQELAEAESNDNGKPLQVAQTVDIPRSVMNFRFFAAGALHFASESHTTAHAVNYTLREPLGVVGCISPWNLPLYLFTWKIAPALAAGNCVVAKPSEITPMTAYLLARICEEVGLPPGVLNIIHGRGEKVGESIVTHPQVTAVSFTGGTATGARIAKSAAPHFKKLSLEMGGKNPALIFADCDFDKMIEGIVRSSFSNQGQICLCSSRLYIEKPIYEKFRDALVERVKALQIGDPLDPRTQQGAIVSEQHFHAILGHLQRAKELGAKVLCGGRALPGPGRCENGFFIEPTVLEGLDIHCETNQQEIFGPVVTITPISSTEEALALANQSAYGLSATIWTQDITRVNRMTRDLKAGVIWVNTWMERDLRTPFGGMKQSGLGREGGWEALRFFTEPKNICIQL